MPNADHCRAMAEEAERLATIVAYTRDKVRLREQAQSWREKAAAMEAACAPAAEEESTGNRLMGWLRRRA